MAANKRPNFIIKRPRIWDYKWLCSAVLVWKISLILVSMAAFDRAQTRPAGQRPSKGKKKREHTKAGGALALDFRESGQLAVQQEVRLLIRQREPLLGQRSQRSVGTWLDPLCALGTLEDRAHQAAVDLSSVVPSGRVSYAPASAPPILRSTLGHYETESVCFQFCCSFSLQ